MGDSLYFFFSFCLTCYRNSLCHPKVNKKRLHILTFTSFYTINEEMKGYIYAKLCLRSLWVYRWPNSNILLRPISYSSVCTFPHLRPHPTLRRRCEPIFAFITIHLDHIFLHNIGIHLLILYLQCFKGW